MTEAHAQLITVIKVEAARGKGIADDPYRRVFLYFSTDGVLLAEKDNWKDERSTEAISE